MATHQTQTPDFDGVALGSTPTCRPQIDSRLLHGFLFQVVGTGSPTFAEYVEYLELSQNDKVKSKFVPGIKRKWDDYHNSNSDSLPSDFFYLDLTKAGFGFSPWGTADIARLTITAKIAAANPSGKTLTRIRGWSMFTPVQTPAPRGDVFVSSVVTTKTPVVGENRMSDLEVRDIIAARGLLLDNNDVGRVRILVGEREVYNMTRDAAYAAARFNPRYKVPSGADSFPVFLDPLGLGQDLIPLVENGVRLPFNIEFDINTGATPAPINILVEGVERGATTPVAAAAA